MTTVLFPPRLRLLLWELFGSSGLFPNPRPEIMPGDVRGMEREKSAAEHCIRCVLVIICRSCCYLHQSNANILIKLRVFYSTAPNRGYKLSKTFSSVQALREVSFQMSQGEVFVILGHNGITSSDLHI